MNSYTLYKANTSRHSEGFTHSFLLLYALAPLSVLSKNPLSCSQLCWAFAVFPLIALSLLQLSHVLHVYSVSAARFSDALFRYFTPLLYTTFGLRENNPLLLAYVKLLVLLEALQSFRTKLKGVTFLTMINVISMALERWFRAENCAIVFVIQYGFQIAAFCALCTRNWTPVENSVQTDETIKAFTETQTEIKRFANTQSQVTGLVSLESAAAQTIQNLREEKGTQTEPAPRADTAAQTDGNDVFMQFFNSLQHPAFIVDLNVNVQAATPNIVNSAAKALLAGYKSLFENAHLEVSNCSLSELLNTFRRRVDRPFLKTDRVKIVPSKALVPSFNTSEAVYDLTVSTFDASNDLRMVGIMMMETPKDREKEKLILEHFKTSLVCSLSHELFSPINSLILALNLLPLPSSEQKEDYKTMALANAELLYSKISDLIDYTKIELNDFKLQESEFYVETLFEELERILKYGGLQKENKLMFKTQTSANRKLLIHADKMRIKQVLIKLITNANKYTEKGEIVVSGSEKQDDLDVIFSVKDTGVGMSKEKLDQIFTSLPEKAKFLHEHNDGSTKLPGLGLEIAKRICEGMGGNLKAVSTQDKGSTFSFEIPVCRIYTTPIIQRIPEVSLLPPRRIEVAAPATPVQSEANLESSPKHSRPEYAIHLSHQGTADPPKVDSISKVLAAPPPEQKRILKRRGSGSGAKSLREEKSMRVSRKIDFFNPRRIPIGRHLEGTATPLASVVEKTESGDIPPENEGGSGDVYEKMRQYSRNAGVGDLRKSVHEYLATDPKHEEKVGGATEEEEEKERGVSEKESHEEGTMIVPAGGEKKQGIVLITDDDSFNRMALRGMLGRLHVKTLEAANGEEAVEVVHKSIQKGASYVVLMILMDLNMPQMDGVQATREIRKLEKSHSRVYKIPIVAVSAHTTEKDMELCYKAGMQEFVPKPINANDIKRIVENYVNIGLNL